jgi:hypothetical protein
MTGAAGESLPGEHRNADDAIAQAELQRFPVGPVVSIGSLLCLAGVIVGLVVATKGPHRHPGEGVAIALIAAAQFLILVLAGVAVSSIENIGLAQIRGLTFRKSTNGRTR